MYRFSSKNLGKRLLTGMAALMLFAACGSDDITSSDGTGSSADSVPDYVADDFDRTVTVTFVASGEATVSGADSEQQTVTVSGNHVTIVNNGAEKVQYELCGTATDGCFKLYSEKKQALLLNSLSLANPTGAAVNVQSHKAVYVVLAGTSTLADGSSYTATPDDEDEKAALFSEGQLIFSGSGSLAVTARGKSGIVSDDYVKFAGGTVTVDCSTSCSVTNGDTLKPACVKGKDDFIMAGGNVTLTASGTGAKGVSGDGTATFSGGTLTVTVSGSNFGSSSGGWGGGSSNSNSVAAKGIKFDGDITITGGTLTVSASKHEGIESKGAITVTGGTVYSYSASDDAINSGGDMTISDGYVCAYGPSNDGLDANGNCYLQGGVVYAIGGSSPEMAIDANSEQQKNIYLTGGVLVAIGNLERGASLTQACYKTSSVSRNTWYALTVGSTVYAFKTPANGSSPLIVSGPSTPSLASGVTVSGGTACFNDMFRLGATCSGGSTVSLSSYSSNSGGGGGGPH